MNDILSNTGNQLSPTQPRKIDAENLVLPQSVYGEMPKSYNNVKANEQNKTKEIFVNAIELSP